jgi:hypothetical protein
MKLSAISLFSASAVQKEHMMSHYTVEELIARWRKEDLTVEQMIGQILQVLRVHEQRLREVTRGAGPPHADETQTLRKEQL